MNDHIWSVNDKREEINLDDLYCVNRFIHLDNFGRNDNREISSSGFAVVVVTTTDSKLLHTKHTILTYLGTQKKIRVSTQLLLIFSEYKISHIHSVTKVPGIG